MSEAVERVPAGPGYVLAVPGQTQAWTRWKAREGEIFAPATRARMMLSVLRQFNEDTGGRFLGDTLADVVDGLGRLAAEGDGHE